MQNHNSKGKSDLKYRCYNFSLSIIRILDDLPKKTAARVIADQLVRSSTSVGANLVEAHSAASRIEFKKYNEIALKSANETKYWLGLLRDAKYLEAERVNNRLAEITEIAKMIASGVLKLKGKR